MTEDITPVKLDHLNKGLAALGILLGLMIAWSESPVFTTLLPLLFALIGGAGGLQISKMDLTKSSNQFKLQAIGRSFFSFCVPCIISILFGFLSYPLFLKIKGGDYSSRYTLETSNPAARGMALILLRKRLEIAGATNDEIKTLIATTIDPHTIEEQAKNIVTVISSLKADYELIPVSDRIKPDQATPYTIDGLYKDAVNAKPQIEEFIKNKKFDRDELMLALKPLDSYSEENRSFAMTVGSATAFQIITKYPQLARDVNRLFLYLQNQRQVYSFINNENYPGSFEKLIESQKNSAISQGGGGGGGSGRGLVLAPRTDID